MRRNIPVTDNDTLKAIKNVSHEGVILDAEPKLSVRKKVITPATIKSRAMVL